MRYHISSGVDTTARSELTGMALVMLGLLLLAIPVVARLRSGDTTVLSPLVLSSHNDKSASPTNANTNNHTSGTASAPGGQSGSSRGNASSPTAMSVNNSTAAGSSVSTQADGAAKGGQSSPVVTPTGTVYDSAPASQSSGPTVQPAGPYGYGGGALTSPTLGTSVGSAPVAVPPTMSNGAGIKTNPDGSCPCYPLNGTLPSLPVSSPVQ